MISHAALPAILFAALSAWAIGSDPAIEWLAKYRPTAGESTLEVNVARQVLTSDARLRLKDPHPRVAIIGSSAVVNGIDAELINKLWDANSTKKTAINLGQTGLIGYELALLKKFTLHPTIDTIVYLYNSFSFADRLLGTVVGVRWNTQEMLMLQPPSLLDPADWRRYSTGIINESFSVVRYGNVIRDIALRAWHGTLRPVPYFFDFPPEPNLDQRRERVAQEPVPDSDWLRAAYLDSERRSDTLGYRGLERFLSLARERGVRVILAPAPEPDFSLFNKWRVGTDPSVVDARVATLGSKYGATVWPRSRTREFENDDTLFRDQTHLNRFGRERYSRAVAEWIAFELR